MRIINQSSTLRKITDELGKRLQRSTQLAQWCGKILIETDLGRDCLEIERGLMAHTATDTNAALSRESSTYRFEIRQDKLIQLMMGRRSIEELAVDGDVSVDAEIVPVLGTLFPLGYPYVWWPDRF